MAGTDVRYATRDAERFDGYLVGPQDGPKVPGILLITAIVGVDQEMRELAAVWAADGCFGGRYADEITCSVSVHFGDSDPIVPMAEVNVVRTAFAGRANADIGGHAGAGHNFAMPYKDGYRPTVATASRARVRRCFESMRAARGAAPSTTQP